MLGTAHGKRRPGNRGMSTRCTQASAKIEPRGRACKVGRHGASIRSARAGHRRDGGERACERWQLAADGDVPGGRGHRGGGGAADGGEQDRGHRARADRRDGRHADVHEPRRQGDRGDVHLSAAARCRCDGDVDQVGHADDQGRDREARRRAAALRGRGEGGRGGGGARSGAARCVHADRRRDPTEGVRGDRAALRRTRAVRERHLAARAADGGRAALRAGDDQRAPDHRHRSLARYGSRAGCVAGDTVDRTAGGRSHARRDSLRRAGDRRDEPDARARGCEGAGCVVHGSTFGSRCRDPLDGDRARGRLGRAGCAWRLCGGGRRGAGESGAAKGAAPHARGPRSRGDDAG